MRCLTARNLGRTWSHHHMRSMLWTADRYTSDNSVNSCKKTRRYKTPPPPLHFCTPSPPPTHRASLLAPLWVVLHLATFASTVGGGGEITPKHGMCFCNFSTSENNCIRLFRISNRFDDLIKFSTQTCNLKILGNESFKWQCTNECLSQVRLYK